MLFISASFSHARVRCRAVAPFMGLLCGHIDSLVENVSSVLSRCASGVGLNESFAFLGATRGRTLDGSALAVDC